jgi:polyisoprenoid-binding protein YceI
MRNKLFVLLLGVVAFYGSALAADEFKIDPVHSTVAFSVKHMVVNTVHGRFNDYSGTINTDNAQRDGHLKSPDFLDAAKYPEITFKSNSVEKKGDGYMAHGTLAIRGVSKNVDMPFKLNGPINVGGSSLLGAEASLTINRQDYGVSWSKTLDGGSLVVSNDVKIDINVEAKQAKPAAAAGASK